MFRSNPVFFSLLFYRNQTPDTFFFAMNCVVFSRLDKKTLSTWHWSILRVSITSYLIVLIFINDLPESTQSRCSIFADDTTLHTADKSNISSSVHVLVLISTQQPHGLKDGACSLAPPRASISQLKGQRNRAHLCEWTGSPFPRSGHINTLGWYLTTHWHGMTTFPMYTARARGCWESWGCGVLMVTFSRCAWKESTKLGDLVWNTRALCGVEDPQGPFNACKILSPNDSDWRSLHWRIDLTITPSFYFTKYVKT